LNIKDISSNQNQEDKMDTEGLLPCTIEEVGSCDCDCHGEVRIKIKDEYLTIYMSSDAAINLAAASGQAELPRPSSYDLIAAILQQCGGKVEGLAITDLKDGIFYGSLSVSHDGESQWYDCRPSDGMNIAIRCQAPIFVHPRVLMAANT